jgi:hypothetical protein
MMIRQLPADSSFSSSTARQDSFLSCRSGGRSDQDHSRST